MSANFRHLFQCGGVIQDRLTKFKPILHAPARDYVVDGGKGEAVMGQVAVLHPFIVRKQASKVNKTLDQYPLVWYNYLCRFFGATFLITHDGDAMDKIEYIRLLDEAIRLADDLNEKIDRMGEMMENGCPVRQ